MKIIFKKTLYNLYIIEIILIVFNNKLTRKNFSHNFAKIFFGNFLLIYIETRNKE